MQHCNHPECAACHHVLAYSGDSELDTAATSMNFLNAYTSALPSYDPPTQSYDPSTQSYDPPTQSYAPGPSFGGDSGGGGATTEF